MLDISAQAQRSAPTRQDSGGSSIVGCIRQRRAGSTNAPRWALYATEDGTERLSNTFAAGLSRDGVGAVLAGQGLTLRADNTVIAGRAPRVTLDPAKLEEARRGHEAVMAIFAEAGAGCPAARTGRDLEMAASDYRGSQDRADAAQAGRAGNEARAREERRSAEAMRRALHHIDSLAEHQATTMLGALAQIIAVNHVAGAFWESDLTAQQKVAAANTVRRLLYSLRDFALRELGERPMPAAGEVLMPDRFNPFGRGEEAMQ